MVLAELASTTIYGDMQVTGDVLGDIDIKDGILTINDSSISGELKIYQSGNNDATIETTSGDLYLDISGNDLHMGGTNIGNVGNVDGVDVSSHVGDSDAHHSRYADSEARSAVTGVDMPGSIHWQPSSSGGSVTGLRFDSNTNSGSDYAEINYHDSFYSDSESGVLELKVENDSYSSAGPDAVVVNATSGLIVEQQALRVKSGEIYANGTQVTRGDYKIEKNGSDGSGVINFKT
mgnify:CR=1 FL=1